MHPTLDSVSVLMLTALPVCLMEQNNCVHIQTCVKVLRTTYASTYTEIFTLSGQTGIQTVHSSTPRELITMVKNL